jgi:hypothetical protein
VADPDYELMQRNKKFPVEIRVRNTHISLCLRDDQTVDGDSVAVEFNGEIITRSISLAKGESCIELDLKPEGPNNLAVHALNLGTIPPNTYEVVYYDGDKRKTLRLKSDMENSSTVSFIVDPSYRDE